jgi:hypothetical protein
MQSEGPGHQTDPRKGLLEESAKRNSEGASYDSLGGVYTQKYSENHGESILDGHSALCDPAYEEEVAERQEEILDLISKKSPDGKRAKTPVKKAVALSKA